MKCESFGKCGSCTLYSLNYEEQLHHKTDLAIKKLGLDITPSFITSPSEHYRNRAEFRIWHEEEKLFFAMNKIDAKQKLIIDSCPKADKAINALFKPLLNKIKKEFILKEKLFGVEFLSAKNEMLITLLYHKKIDETWEKKAKELAQSLQVKIIGRSKGIKKVIYANFVQECLKVNGTSYYFNIYEGSFSQPNRAVNQKMIGWVQDSLKGFSCKDLLELYCGHGNFTIPLSCRFSKVLATEISKPSIKAALENCKLNQTKNTTFLRMSTEELVSALKKEREFFRLKNVDLESFNFSHVFVDPPRAGLDTKSLKFVQNFENIIYISCSVESLARDLKTLLKTHQAVKLAFFDQFPYTHHLESGVLLQKNVRT